MASSDSSGAQPPDLGYTICSRLSVCNVNMPFAACQSAVLNLAGLGSKLGSTDVNSTLSQLSQTPPDSNAYGRCEAEIMALTCQEAKVQAAYDANSATPWAGVVNMIPQNGNCPNIY